MRNLHWSVWLLVSWVAATLVLLCWSPRGAYQQDLTSDFTQTSSLDPIDRKLEPIEAPVADAQREELVGLNGRVLGEGLEGKKMELHLWQRAGADFAIQETLEQEAILPFCFRSIQSPGADLELEVCVRGYETWRYPVHLGEPIEVRLRPKGLPVQVECEIQSSRGIPVLEPSVAYSLRTYAQVEAGEWLDTNPWQRVWAPAGRWKTTLMVDPSAEPVELHMQVRAHGLAETGAVVLLTPGALEPVQLRFVLMQGASCSGWVYSALGPVEGAEVCVLDLEQRPLACGRSQAPDGEFVLDSFEASKAGELWIQARGFAPARLQPAEWQTQSSGIVVQLAEGATLEGTLRDAAGQPLGGQQLRVLVGGRKLTLDPVPWGQVATETDSSGRYRMAGLPPGTWPVEWIENPSPTASARCLGTVSLVVGETLARDFVLEQGVRLAGQVHLPQALEDALAFLQVFAIDPSSGERGELLARWSGVPGEYSIAGIPEGEILVRLLESEAIFADQRVMARGTWVAVPPFEFSEWQAYEAWVGGVQPR